MLHKSMNKKSETISSFRKKGNIMKKAGVICISAFLSTSVFAQITLDVKQQTIKQTLRTIEKATDYRFFYSNQLPDLNKTVSFEVNNQSIDATMNKLLNGTGLFYEKREDNQIYLAAKNARGEEKIIKISGTILDNNNEPIIGANVSIKGTTTGTITDIDGNFTIEVGESDVLQITFIGLETQLVPVRGKASMKIVMKELRDELEEVTVVAFAKQKKESVIGSIQTVKPAELKTPSSNLTTSLAGRMAGVIAYQRSGEPGKDNANFFIRGVTTFGYKKDPLILLDNVEVSSDDLARVQPDDIASFSVLKDATSTALYGARGANGVILVTTKEGKEGKAQVSVRVENSFSAPTKMIDIADPISYMRLNNEAVLTRDPQGVIPYPESKIANTMAPNRNPYVYPTVDWMKEMFKDYTVNQRVNFNVRGGGSVATYYLAGTFSNDTGLLKNDGLNNFNSNISLKKYNILSTFNIHLTKTTEVKVRFQADFDDYRGPVDGGNILFDHAIHASPVDFPKYYLPDLQNQGVGHPLFGNVEGANHINPYAIMTSGYKDYSRTNISAQAEIEQNLDFITEGLTVQGHFSTVRRSYFDVSRSYTPYYYKIGFYDKESDNYVLQALNPDSGTEYLGYSEGPKDVYTQIYMQAKANYARKFGLHDVGALLVYQRKEELLGNAGSVIKSLPKRNQGISGRMSYGYDSRYFAEFNFGYNGSERFAQNERYGFFPSIGGAWMLSNEAFWRPIEKVANKLKLKVTYGLVGNDAIGSDSDRFFYLSNMNMNSSGRGQVFGTNWGNYKDGISTVRYPNEFITWEVAKKLNIGFELGLFNSLDVQFDYFREDRSKILMDRSFIPTTMGLEASVRANVGEAASHGVDLSVNYNHWFNNKIWLQGYGNFTYATSEFKVADEPDYAAARLPWRSRVGYSLSQQWGYIAERLFVDEADIANSPVQSFGTYLPGDIKYKDINKDGKISDADLVPIGYPTTPEITYGFGLSMGFKNWDISCFFQGSARSSFFIDSEQIAPFNNPPSTTGSYTRKTALFQAIADSYWSEEHRDIYAFWPRLSTESIKNNTQVSTWWMRDGSFMRLKSLELGYSFPQQMIKKIHLTKLRLYANGTNLLTFSKFKLWDPEMGGLGVGYPNQRVINLGIQVDF